MHNVETNLMAKMLKTGGPTPKKASATGIEKYLVFVGVLQLLKGVALAALGVGFLHFMHKDVDVIVATWFSEVGISLENPHIAALLDRLDSVTDRQLGRWSVVLFCLSAVFLAEGSGLLMKQKWAKYLTIVATAAFVPPEAFTLIQRFRFIKLGLLLVNLALVGILIVNLRRESRHELAAGKLDPGALELAEAASETATVGNVG